MRRRIISLCLALAIAFSAVGCINTSPAALKEDWGLPTYANVERGTTVDVISIQVEDTKGAKYDTAVTVYDPEGVTVTVTGGKFVASMLTTDTNKYVVRYKVTGFEGTPHKDVTFSTTPNLADKKTAAQNEVTAAAAAKDKESYSAAKLAIIAEAVDAFEEGLATAANEDAIATLKQTALAAISAVTASVPALSDLENYDSAGYTVTKEGGKTTVVSNAQKTGYASVVSHVTDYATKFTQLKFTIANTGTEDAGIVARLVNEDLIPTDGSSDQASILNSNNSYGDYLVIPADGLEYTYTIIRNKAVEVDEDEIVTLVRFIINSTGEGAKLNPDTTSLVFSNIEFVAPPADKAVVGPMLNNNPDVHNIYGNTVVFDYGSTIPSYKTVKFSVSNWNAQTKNNSSIATIKVINYSEGDAVLSYKVATNDGDKYGGNFRALASGAEMVFEEWIWGGGTASAITEVTQIELAINSNDYSEDGVQLGHVPTTLKGKLFIELTLRGGETLNQSTNNLNAWGPQSFGTVLLGDTVTINKVEVATTPATTAYTANIKLIDQPEGSTLSLNAAEGTLAPVVAGEYVLEYTLTFNGKEIVKTTSFTAHDLAGYKVAKEEELVEYMLDNFDFDLYSKAQFDAAMNLANDFDTASTAATTIEAVDAAVAAFVTALDAIIAAPATPTVGATWTEDGDVYTLADGKATFVNATSNSGAYFSIPINNYVQNMNKFTVTLKNEQADIKLVRLQLISDEDEVLNTNGNGFFNGLEVKVGSEATVSATVINNRTGYEPFSGHSGYVVELRVFINTFGARIALTSSDETIGASGELGIEVAMAHDALDFNKYLAYADDNGGTQIFTDEVRDAAVNYQTAQNSNNIVFNFGATALNYKGLNFDVVNFKGENMKVKFKIQNTGETAITIKPKLSFANHVDDYGGDVTIAAGATTDIYLNIRFYDASEGTSTNNYGSGNANFENGVDRVYILKRISLFINTMDSGPNSLPTTGSLKVLEFSLFDAAEYLF